MTNAVSSLGSYSGADLVVLIVQSATPMELLEDGSERAEALGG